MKLALKNLIISELTCQEWKTSKTVTKTKLSEKEKNQEATPCSIELLSEATIKPNNLHNIN